MVLDGGRLIEFDAPAVLLQNETSIFTAIVEETGDASNLRTIAQNAYKTQSTKYQ